MGILSRLLQPTAATEGERRGVSLTDPTSWLVSALGGGSSASGVNVSVEGSMNYAAVLSAVRVLAEGVAQLPLLVYERQERGRRRATSHRLYALLHTSPNPGMTSFELRELQMVHLALWGNAFCEVQRTVAGDAAALWPLMPQWMTVHATADGGRWYEYKQPGFPDVVLRSDQVLHIPGMGYDGVAGKSLIRMARESVGLGIAAERYGSAYFANGARPSIAIKHPGELTDKAAKHLRESWNENHAGLANAQRMAILEEGMDLVPFGVPPEDAQFLETRKFQRTEIAAIMRVPPHMIGDLDRASFSNIEQQSLDFVIYTLTPWLVRIEQRVGLQLLSAADRQRYYVEHLVEGLLRGDIASRYQAYATGRQWGWLSANDVRELENMNPVADGDAYLVPLNMVEMGTPAPEASSQRSEVRGRRSEVGEPDERRLIGSREVRATNAAAARRRVIDANRAALEDAAQRVVNREVNDIGNAARKYLRAERHGQETGRSGGQAEQRSVGEFETWLADFVESHREFIRDRMWASVWTFAQLVSDAALREAEDAGFDPADVSANVQAFTSAMLAGRAEQWTAILQTRLEDRMAAATSAGEDPLVAVEDTLAERRDGYAEDWSRDSGTAFGNAVAVTVFAVVGVLSLRWVAFGENCPYCTNMNGRRVGVSEWFVMAGNAVEPDGHPPLLPGSAIRHPPLHKGCDCAVVIG